MKQKKYICPTTEITYIECTQGTADLIIVSGSGSPDVKEKHIWNENDEEHEDDWNIWK